MDIYGKIPFLLHWLILFVSVGIWASLGFMGWLYRMSGHQKLRNVLSPSFPTALSLEKVRTLPVLKDVPWAHISTKPLPSKVIQWQEISNSFLTWWLYKYLKWQTVNKLFVCFFVCFLDRLTTFNSLCSLKCWVVLKMWVTTQSPVTQLTNVSVWSEERPFAVASAMGSWLAQPRAYCSAFSSSTVETIRWYSLKVTLRSLMQFCSYLFFYCRSCRCLKKCMELYTEKIVFFPSYCLLWKDYLKISLIEWIGSFFWFSI